MVVKLTEQERETLISMDATDRSKWIIYSSDPVMINRLDKVASATREDEWGKKYILDANQVRLFKPLTPLTGEKLREAQERGKKLHER